MTTAHVPTWAAALASASGARDGSTGAPTRQVSSRDLSAHTLLKLRTDRLLLNADEKDSLGSDSETQRLLDDREFRQKLFEKERQERLFALKSKNQAEEEETIEAKGNAPTSSSSSSEEDQEDEDEEEALLRELEKIRAERQADKQRQEKELLMSENPLLAPKRPRTATSASASASWTNDVVFKNHRQIAQAEATERRLTAKRFINDTIRSDFHRRFMERYIR